MDRLNGLLRKTQLFMGCSVGFKYAKNALAAGAPPWTSLGEFTTLPQTSWPLTQGRTDGRGKQGAMAPQTMDKKIKLSCRITHIDALEVAVINDHKQLINSSFPPFEAYHNTKKCSASGGFTPWPLTRGPVPEPRWGHSPHNPVILARALHALAIWAYMSPNLYSWIRPSF